MHIADVVVSIQYGLGLIDRGEGVVTPSTCNLLLPGNDLGSGLLEVRDLDDAEERVSTAAKSMMLAEWLCRFNNAIEILVFSQPAPAPGRAWLFMICIWNIFLGWFALGHVAVVLFAC